MSGGDKILNRIKADCDKTVSDILKEADDKCAEILKNADAQAKDAADAISKKADLKVEQIKKSSKSRCELEIRNTILNKRRDEIDRTIADVQDYILNLNDNEYFDYLYKLASTLNVNSGEVFLNQKDLNRVPSDFIDKFNSAGINAQLSENTVDIIGGFILKNGNIEENMAIDAVIMSKKDVLEDIISRELFK